MNSDSERPAEVFWSGLISDSEWEVYSAAIDALQSRGIRFAIGGGFAFATYANRWRNTKDLDFFIQPADQERTRAALDAAGFDDYYDQHPYDRSWIYRSTRDGAIADVIWTMANHRTEVDCPWLCYGPEVALRGRIIRLLPVEELIWAKLYVLQRDRTDWPDILNVMHAQVEQIDWARLIERVGKDTLVLGAVVNVLRWLSPQRARVIPGWALDRMGLGPAEASGADPSAQAAILDSREWFGPTAEGAA